MVDGAVRLQDLLLNEGMQTATSAAELDAIVANLKKLTYSSKGELTIPLDTNSNVQVHRNRGGTLLLRIEGHAAFRAPSETAHDSTLS